MKQAVRNCHLLVLIVAVQACGGDGGAPPAGSQATGVFANRVIDYAPTNSTGASEANWPFFFHPEAVIGEPGGTFSVVSLGYDRAPSATTGGSITVGLGNPGDLSHRACVVDGAGSDLAVYENPFHTVDPETMIEGTNSEVATVEVSLDNITWHLFPPFVDTDKPAIDPSRYTNLAGVTPTAEGGDRFDLNEIIIAEGLAADYRACYVRLTDGGTAYPDYGNTQSDLFASGADIDAVEAVYSAPAPGLVP